MAETDRRGLQTSVSAANIDEKLGSGNCNLLAVKYPLLLSLAGEAYPDSRPASGTIIFASGSPERGSEGKAVCQAYQLGSPTVQRAAQLLMLALKDAKLMLSPAPAQQLWGLDRD